MFLTNGAPRPGGRLSAASGGFTLVEVLVALIVLSIGLLGLAALQLQSLKHNTDAYFRTQATMLAYDIIDRMRANVDGAMAGYYVAAEPPASAQTCGEVAGGCSSLTDLAAYDLTEWYQALADALPAATTPSSIALNGNRITVTIRWNERGVPKSREWVVEL